MSLYEDRKGNLWAAVMNGFWRWKPGPPDFYSVPGALDGIRAFIESDDGGLLFTGLGGINRLMNGKIEPYSIPGNLQPLRVMRMLRDRDGGLWLGTWDRGIVHVHQGKTEAYSNGLSGVDIAGLLEDSEGNIWVVTSTGVDRFRAPAANRITPRVRIKQITADGKIFDVSNGLRLPPLVRDVTIDYTALTLVGPEKIHFRYKLDGQDPHWREVVNDRKVQYSNLPSGDYHFHVTACNSSGVWNEAGASLAFSIAPAYYQTIWFRAACVTALLLALWGLHGLRLRRLAKEFNLRMDERVNERTRIARELHDTLLQSFQGALLYFQAGVNLLPDRPDNGRAKQQLEGAMDQAAQAIAEGRDAVQDLRSSTIQTNDLAMALKTLAGELAANETNQSAPAVGVRVEGESRDLHPILRDEVYRIAAEALRNAFRHAQAKRIEVEIHYDVQKFRLRVRDDGRGMDAKIVAETGRPGHYGLRGMRERAKAIGGNLELWSNVESGTEIELTIRANTAYAGAAQRRSWFPRKGNAVNP